ncbi:MAG: tRNA (adenosine(37)-N6)-threonylcarbamoyltransferase complex dimerization subunit type 1 TsaB [Candidatus Saccharimonadales bacterium]
MTIITVRTDKPEAEIGLYDGKTRLAYREWQAHRQLASTIHANIKELLTVQGKDWADIQAIVAYKGPGSFTGLRIGLTVANALADSLGIPAVGESGDGWIEQGIARLARGEAETFILPEYGAPVHITAQKK